LVNAVSYRLVTTLNVEGASSATAVYEPTSAEGAVLSDLPAFHEF
jgi:hypothetical protein